MYFFSPLHPLLKTLHVVLVSLLLFVCLSSWLVSELPLV